MEEGKYIYCIVPVGERKSFGAIGIGGRGDEVYTVCHNAFGAVISDTPVIKYSVSRENTIAHEQAIEKAMQDHPVLPVRFGTIAVDEEKIRRILETERDHFAALFDKLRNKKELGVKVVFREDRIYGHILEKYDDIRAMKEKIAALPPEKTRYQRMEIGKMVENALEKEKEAEREHILDALAPIASEIKNNALYGERMLVNSAFLVEQHRENEFDRMVNELAGEYGDRMVFKYVGTVPPFNFVNLVIETGGY